MKYGSPTTSLPRRPTSTTTRAGRSVRRGGSGGSSGRSRSRRGARPMPSRISAVSGKASALHVGVAGQVRRGSTGSATALPSTRKSTASSEPASPQKRPSSMNGPRTNQFVAPTSFITSISRRREKIESRIVFAIRSIDAISRIAVASVNTASITCATWRMRCDTCLPSSTRSTPGGLCGSTIEVVELVDVLGRASASPRASRGADSTSGS